MSKSHCMQKKSFSLNCAKKHVQTVAKMIVIKESYADILQFWYADVMFNGKIPPYATAFAHWRHSKFCKCKAHQIIWKNSLSEGMESHGGRDSSMSLDALSGAFMCRDKELSCTVDQIYIHEFGGALNRLEYKKNHECVSCVHLDPIPFKVQDVDEEHSTYLQ